jgi:hypothetical protein
MSTATLARIYETGNDVTGDLVASGFASVWRELVYQHYQVLVPLYGLTIEFKPGQPFEHFDELPASLDAGYLWVSTDFNESELNGSAGNLLFRAVHDICHWRCDVEHREQGVRCNFELTGETRAMHRQVSEMLSILRPRVRADYFARVAPTIVQVAFSEVVLQAAVFYHRGDFADQKVVLAPMGIINAWLGQNGLARLV